MSIKDDLKHYIAVSGWNLTKVTDELNKRNNTDLTIQNLSKKINNETLKYSDVLEIAEIIGYKLTWEKAHIPENGLTSDISKVKNMPNIPGEGAELFNGSGTISSAIKSEFVEIYKKQLQEDLFKAFINSYINLDERKK